MSNHNDNNTTCAIQTITPDLAKQWLGHNMKNRKLSDPVVKRLTGIITRGEWMSDATDGIGLANDGGVVNGQHRLAAIIEADQPVDALVVHNVRPEVIKVIDQGRGRTFSQWLQMDGRYENAPILAAAIDSLYRINHGLEMSVPTAYKSTIPQLLDLLAEHPNITHSMPAGSDVFAKLRVPSRPWLVAYHYCMASVDSDLADDFFSGLASGVDLADRSPVYALREKLLKEGALDSSRRARGFVYLAWLVKAWEAFRQGQEMTPKQLSWTTGGRRGEPFPQVSELPWAVSDQAIENEEDEDNLFTAADGFDDDGDDDGS
jgi:hypothetical protein